MKSLFDLLDNWRNSLENFLNINIPKIVFNIVTILVISLLLITIVKYVVISTPSSNEPVQKNYTIKPTSIQNGNTTVINGNRLIYRSRYRDKTYDLTDFTEYIWDFAGDVSGEKLPDFKTLPDSTKNELMQESLMLIMSSQEEIIKATNSKTKEKGNKN